MLPLLSNLVCNNYLNSDVWEIFMNGDVTCDWLCWISTILVCMLVVSDPSRFHWTTRFIWAQVWWFDHFGDYYCTYALINWTVLWHLPSPIPLHHHWSSPHLQLTHSSWALWFEKLTHSIYIRDAASWINFLDLIILFLILLLLY